jgi:ubiquinone biosynthesis protein
MANDPVPSPDGQPATATATPLPAEEFEVFAEARSPGLTRRLLVTYRHFLGLLFGGLEAYLRALPADRRFGLRYRSLWLVNAVSRNFVADRYLELPFPVQLRRRLEALGATYIKLGQVLALRKDLLPERVTSELASLLDRLPALPYRRFLELVERDLGRDPFTVFAYVETQPLASASIAQVHRAGTLDGQAVILKRIKPGIRATFRRDIALLRGVGRLLDPLLPRFEPRRAIDEFSYYLLRELDFEIEADNAEIFASHFADEPGVAFPRILRQYSNANLLCMEYLRGFKPSSPEARELSPGDRDRVIDLGAGTIVRMLFRDGLFHADLHPANILVMPGPRVGFIDLGQVGRFEPELRRRLLLYYYFLVTGDAEHAARYLAAIATPGPRADPQGFCREVEDVSRRWRRHRTAAASSLGELILESLARGVRFRMYFPVELVLMVKAIITFESVGRMLDPDLDVAVVTRRHLNDALFHQYNPLRLGREGLRSAPELLDTAVKVPALISTGLRALESAASRPPENPFAGMRGTMFAGFSLVAGALVVALRGPLPVALLLFGLAALSALRRGR